MARLPSSFDVSGPSPMVSKRAIAQVDTTGLGRGLAQAGNALQSLGGELEAKQRERQQQENVVDVSRAEALKTKGFLDTENEFSQDGDYSTFLDRAPKKTGEIVKSAANVIRDPKMRERWEAGAQTDAVRVNDAIGDRGRGLAKQAETTAFDEALETNRRIFVDPNVPLATQEKAKADIEASIQTGLKSGLLTPVEADARREAYIKNANFSRAKLAAEKDPSIIVRPLPADKAERVNSAVSFFQSKGWSKEQAGAIVGNLLAESGLNTTARNSGDGSDGSDSIGAGQWNGARAQALKSFAAANGTDWHDLGTQLAFVDHELRTTESAAGNALKAAKNVEEATAAFIGYERPQGWSADNPRGGHNYKGRLRFAMQAAGVDGNPDWFKDLSPEQRFQVDKVAESRRNELAVESRASIEIASQNAPAAIQATGTYDGALPTPEQFMDAYGPEQGIQKYQQFDAAVDVSKQAYDFRTMSTEQIMAAVQEATPRSSDDGAALEQKKYDTLSNAADQTIKARNADPSTYVRQAFPSVRTAWDNAGTPEGYQNALNVTAAAQQQIGVKDMMLLPKQTADDAVTKFKDATVPENDRISAISGMILATPDPAQRQAVFNQLVKSGLPDITEGAVEALARGDEGAARRLFQAAILDPSKLPGNIAETPKNIEEQIQSTVMDDGLIGDVYYGLSDGTVENFERAQRDSKLINNAVQLRIRNGESLDAAVKGAAKDLYGDVKVVNGNGGVNAQVLLPTNQDPTPVLSGLEASKPVIRDAITSSLVIPKDAPATDGTKAVIDAATRNYAENVMNNGYFRNAGDGFVFIDPYVGAAIAGKDGKPITFSMDQVLKAAADKKTTRQFVPPQGGSAIELPDTPAMRRRQTIYEAPTGGQ